MAWPPEPRRSLRSPVGKRMSAAPASPPLAKPATRYFVLSTTSPRPVAEPDSRSVFVVAPGLPVSKVCVSGSPAVASRTIVASTSAVRFDVHHRHDHANVPAVRDAVAERQRRSLHGRVEGEGGFDDVSLERRAQPAAVRLLDRAGPAALATTASARAAAGTGRAALGVTQVELDGAVTEIAPFEARVMRALIGEAAVELVPAQRQGALGERRAEARARPPERAQRLRRTCR